MTQIQTTTAAPALLSIEGLHKSYGPVEVLKGVDLKMNKGNVVTLIGSSGSGKTTLLRCVNLLEEFQGGHIRLEGQDIGYSDVNGKRVRHPEKVIAQHRAMTGMAFQQFNLFPHLTVLENLMIGPMKVRKLPAAKAEETARKYLDRVHIPEQADKYPAQLSGGQQQRVAIARSLCMESRIMLFDEPTSALDPEMINEVLDVMVGLAESGMTMVVVTHEMGFARKVADTMVFMEEGEIVEISPPDQFFTNPSSERCRLFLDQILAH